MEVSKESTSLPKIQAPVSVRALKRSNFLPQAFAHVGVRQMEAHPGIGLRNNQNLSSSIQDSERVTFAAKHPLRAKWRWM